MTALDDPQAPARDEPRADAGRQPPGMPPDQQQGPGCSRTRTGGAAAWPPAVLPGPRGEALPELAGIGSDHEQRPVARPGPHGSQAQAVPGPRDLEPVARELRAQASQVIAQVNH